jgi:uncharacterized coiled-coil protein SlyX
LANQDHALELASLKAALDTYRAGEQDDRAVKDSKIALKARLSALQAQTAEQTATIQSLRAELAAANERLARQGAQFREELRALGGGGADVRSSTAVARLPPAAEPRRRALSERIRDPRGPRPAPSEDADGDAETEGVRRARGRIGGREGRDAESSGAVATPGSADAQDPATATGVREGPGGEGGAGRAERRPRLLERITGLDKPSA